MSFQRKRGLEAADTIKGAKGENKGENEGEYWRTKSR
jgi:hypothetical protein